MSAVYGAIITHKLRTAKGMLKHFWPSFLGLLGAVVYLGYRLIVVDLRLGFGKPLDPLYVPYLFWGCVLLNGYRLLLKQTPVIGVNAGTVHFLYHTAYFRKLLLIEYLWALVKSMLIAIWLAAMISGMQQPLFFYNALLLTLYLYSGVMLAWVRYHGNSRERWITLVLYVLASGGLFVPTGAFGLVLLAIVALGVSYYVVYKLHLDLVRYLRDVSLQDRNMASASQFNMAQMSQITAEYTANRRRRLLLHQLPLKPGNALFLKCFVATMRTSTRIWFILLILLLSGVLLHRTPIFTGLPFIADPAVATPTSVLLLMMVYANIAEMLKGQLKTLLQKERQGLFLPREKWQVVSVYIGFGHLLYLALTILVGVLMGSKSTFVIIFYVLYSVTFALDMLNAVKAYIAKRPVQTVLRIFCVMLGFLFVA